VYSSQDAKVDQGAHLFISDEHSQKKVIKSMLQNNIYKYSIYYVQFFHEMIFIDIQELSAI